MKIDRLIGILSILLQQEKVTAPYLAEKFEVSRRTINRDIEDLCKAGIPIATSQGAGGGISIMEGYAVDRTLLSSSDMQAILAGLRGLDSVSGTNRYRQLMDKLSAGASEGLSAKTSSEMSDVLIGDQHLLIDLSSWYRDSLTPKIELIHDAVRGCNIIEFMYFSPKKEELRQIEPDYLIFHWSSWYVWGWCRLRSDWRMFKLNRLSGLRCTGEKFEKRSAPLPDLSTDKIFPCRFQAKILFAPEYKWRLIEEFGPDSFTEQSDGMLLFSFGFSDGENLLSWILTFGEKAELLEPAELRRQLGDIAGALARKYEGL